MITVSSPSSHPPFLLFLYALSPLPSLTSSWSTGRIPSQSPTSSVRWLQFRSVFIFPFFYNSCRRARQIFTRRRRDLSVRLFSSRSNRERADNHPRGSWEFICNLGFEWGLVSGRRQWRWTIAVSSASFLTSLPRPCVFHVGQRVFPNSFTLPLGWLPSPMY